MTYVQMCLLLSGSLCVNKVAAWYDWGHMAVAAVAQEYLKAQGRQDLVEKVYSIVGFQSTEFPDWSTFVSSAIWSDHIKCMNSTDGKSGNGNICDGTSKFDDFNIMDDLHYNDIPLYYTSQCTGTNETADDVMRYVLNSQPGAATTIKYILHSTSLNYVDPTEVVTNVQKRSLNLRPGSSAPRRSLSRFGSDHATSWSLAVMLKMLIHLYGDIHMPLHAAASFSPITGCQNDLGGSLMQVSMTDCNFYPDLHHLWDSGCCYTANVAWPNYTESDAVALATTLMSTYPYTYFDGTTSPWMVNGTFYDAIKESFEVAETYVYRCIDWTNTDPNYKINLDSCNILGNGTTIEKSYIDTCKLISEQRIVLAGYRLADTLVNIATQFPATVLEYNGLPQVSANINIASASILVLVLASVFSNYM